MTKASLQGLAAGDARVGGPGPAQHDVVLLVKEVGWRDVGASQSAPDRQFRGKAWGEGGGGRRFPPV